MCLSSEFGWRSRADFTPGDFDSPPYAASSGVDYAFSPDSSEIAYLKNPDKVEAISTNSDIIVRVAVHKSGEEHHCRLTRLRRVACLHAGR